MEILKRRVASFSLLFTFFFLLTGRRIAELEMETFVARVVENFRIEWFGDTLKQYQSALNYVKGPYSFYFKDV